MNLNVLIRGRVFYRIYEIENEYGTRTVKKKI